MLNIFIREEIGVSIKVKYVVGWWVGKARESNGGEVGTTVIEQQQQNIKNLSWNMQTWLHRLCKIYPIFFFLETHCCFFWFNQLAVSYLTHSFLVNSCVYLSYLPSFSCIAYLLSYFHIFLVCFSNLSVSDIYSRKLIFLGDLSPGSLHFLAPD